MRCARGREFQPGPLATTYDKQMMDVFVLPNLPRNIVILCTSVIDESKMNVEHRSFNTVVELIIESLSVVSLSLPLIAENKMIGDKISQVLK